VAAFGYCAVMSATVPREFFIVMTTPVFGPGAGETRPVITIGCVPEYDARLVWSVTA